MKTTISGFDVLFLGLEVISLLQLWLWFSCRFGCGLCEGLCVLSFQTQNKIQGSELKEL